MSSSTIREGLGVVWNGQAFVDNGAFIHGLERCMTRGGIEARGVNKEWGGRGPRMGFNEDLVAEGCSMKRGLVADG